MLLCGLTLAMAACTEAGSSSSAPAGCGGCEQELAALTETLEGLPSVQSVDMATFGTQTNGRGELYVRLTASGEDLGSTDTAALADELTETAWKSDLQPLDHAEIVFALRSGYYESAVGDFGRDRSVYEGRWGPRPEGTVWSPIDSEAPVEGCGRCIEETRELARAIEALRSVDTVTEASYGTDGTVDVSSLRVAFRRAGDADPADRIAELVWRSRVTPLDAVVVTDESSEGIDEERLDLRPDSADHATYEERWGPRPVQ